MTRYVRRRGEAYPRLKLEDPIPPDYELGDVRPFRELLVAAVVLFMCSQDVCQELREEWTRRATALLYPLL